MNNLKHGLAIGLTLFVHLTFGQIQFYGESASVSVVNSDASENFIALHPDGQTMVFTRTDYAGNVAGVNDEGDIWISRNNQGWGEATNWIELNDRFFTSPIGFSVSGNQFLFNHVALMNGSLESDIKVFSNGKVESLNLKIFKNKSLHQTGSLSYDEKFIVISMQSSATKGNEDIYVLRREGDKWSAPINLGNAINTPSQEITPFLAADNKTLFFSSNGRKGYGSFDIYYATRLDDTWRNWSEPVNLGPKINSNGAESSFAFLSDGEEAYFVSTTNSDGYGDIRSIRIKPGIEKVDRDTIDISTTQIKASVTGVRILNSKTGEPVTGKITISYNDRRPVPYDLTEKGD